MLTAMVVPHKKMVAPSRDTNHGPVVARPILWINEVFHGTNHNTCGFKNLVQFSYLQFPISMLGTCLTYV